MDENGEKIMRIKINEFEKEMISLMEKTIFRMRMLPAKEEALERAKLLNERIKTGVKNPINTDTNL